MLILYFKINLKCGKCRISKEIICYNKVIIEYMHGGNFRMKISFCGFDESTTIKEIRERYKNEANCVEIHKYREAFKYVGLFDAIFAVLFGSTTNTTENGLNYIKTVYAKKRNDSSTWDQNLITHTIGQSKSKGKDKGKGKDKVKDKGKGKGEITPLLDDIQENDTLEDVYKRLEGWENWESEDRKKFFLTQFSGTDKAESQSNEKFENKAYNLFRDNKQIIFTGPPGTGKTREAKIEAAKITGIDVSEVDEEIAKFDGRIKFVQFHPSYSYFDFVEGIEAGKNGFELKNKVFKEFAGKAYRSLNNNKAQDSNVGDTSIEGNESVVETSDEKTVEENNNNYVLIIDEINRANMASVFGELLYALEYRGKKISTSGSTLVVPDNLYIIGTMNTADVSIAGIDYAVRRRFDFIKMNSHMPDGEFYNRVRDRRDRYEIKGNKIKLKDEEWKDLSKWEYDENYNLSSYMVGDKWFIGNLYNRVRIDLQNSIARGVEIEDIMPGISYFLVNGKNESVDEKHLQYKINYELVPLLLEYAKNGLFSKRYKIDPDKSLYEMLKDMTYSERLNAWLNKKDEESSGDSN